MRAQGLGSGTAAWGGCGAGIGGVSGVIESRKRDPSAFSSVSAGAEGVALGCCA